MTYFLVFFSIFSATVGSWHFIFFGSIFFELNEQNYRKRITLQLIFVGENYDNESPKGVAEILSLRAMENAAREEVAGECLGDFSLYAAL